MQEKLWSAECDYWNVFYSTGGAKDKNICMDISKLLTIGQEYYINQAVVRFMFTSYQGQIRF